MSVKNTVKASPDPKSEMPSEGSKAKKQVDAKQDIISKGLSKPVQPKAVPNGSDKPKTGIFTPKSGNAEKKPVEIFKSGKNDGARESTKPSEDYLFCFSNICKANGTSAGFYSNGTIEIKFVGGTVIKGDRTTIEKKLKSEKKDCSNADIELLQKILEACNLVNTILYNEEPQSIVNVNRKIQQQAEPESTPQYFTSKYGPPNTQNPVSRPPQNDVFKKANPRPPISVTREGYKPGEYQQDQRRSSHGGYDSGSHPLSYQQKDMQYVQGPGRNSNLQHSDAQITRQRRNSASSQPHYGGNRVQQGEGSGNYAAGGYIAPLHSWGYFQPNQTHYYHAQQPYYEHSMQAQTYSAAYPNSVHQPPQYFQQGPDGNVPADYYSQQYTPEYHQG